MGFGWAAYLASQPIYNPSGVKGAKFLYHSAQAQDKLMGNNWSEGASVLAGAKATTIAGYASEYRWATGVDDIIDALVSKGPVVIGTDWLGNMFYPTSDGLLDVSGDIAGGHCYLINGFWPNHPQFGDVFTMLNSWGFDWGIKGMAFLKVVDMQHLFNEDADACIAVEIKHKGTSPWNRLKGLFK